MLMTNTVFKTLKNPPPSLFITPNCAKLATPVRNFAKNEIPTTTIRKVIIKAII